MLLWATFDQNSVIVRVKILDSTATTGAGKTGLSSSSSGLIISTIADSESAATAYTQAGSTIESITTLGTYAAPTATKCRFKEVDATNHPGIYEVQFADARFSIASAKSLLISISGASGGAQCDAVISLPTVDLFDSVRGGMTALPNAAAEASGGLYTRGSGAGQINQAANGQVDTNTVKVGGTTQTARDLGASVLLSSGSGTGQLDFTSGVVKSNVTQFNGSNATSSSGRPEVNTTHVGGTSQTARDLGASVLLSSGSGTGQLDFTSGVVKANVTQFGGSAATSSGGRPEVNTTHLAGTAQTARDLSSDVILDSLSDVSPAAGSFKGTSALSSTDDFYNGAVLAFTSGTLKGIARKISAYTGSTRLFSFAGAAGAADAPFPTAPSNGNTFEILGRIG